MRLTGGQGKGRRLKQPPSSIRPTSARTRETLFQLVAGRIEDAAVLDLFAGSGLLGLESLARGAKEAVFIEKDRVALKVIRENIGLCGFDERTAIITGDVFRILKNPGSLPGPFDLVFADPPYAEPVFSPLLEVLNAGGLVGGGGLVVFEVSSRAVLTRPAGWELAEERAIGDTRLVMLEPE